MAFWRFVPLSLMFVRLILVAWNGDCGVEVALALLACCCFCWYCFGTLGPEMEGGLVY